MGVGKEGGGWGAEAPAGPELGEPSRATGSYTSSRNRIRTLQVDLVREKGLFWNSFWTRFEKGPLVRRTFKSN